MLDLLPDGVRVLLARVLLVAAAYLVIFALRSLVTWLLARPLKSILRRLGAQEMDTVIRGIITAPVRLLLLALWLDVSARILELTPALSGFVFNVTRTLVIIALAVIVYRVVDVAVMSPRRLLLLTGVRIEEALLPFLRAGISLLVIAILAVIILQEWGYDVSGLIAGLGLGGLAISLAAQDLLSNLFGFAAVISDRPFVIGEYIKTPEVEGIVEHVGLRSSRVRQLDQAIVTVPNSKLASGTVLNWSRLRKRRIDMTIGVRYETPVAKLSAVVQAIRSQLATRPSVDSASIVVYLIGFGDFSLDILVRCYVNIPDWTEFTAEKERVLLDLLSLLQTHGVSIAFPSQTVYVTRDAEVELPS